MDEDLERVYKEIHNTTSKEVIETLGEYKTNLLIMKIIEAFKGTKWLKNIEITEFKMSSNENKNGERIFFVRASFLKHGFGQIDYFAFDANGNYLGCVKTALCNLVEPNQVEMEYWANQEHVNQGNMTVLAREVIKEIFMERIFDGMRTRKDGALSNINSIMVAINKDNYPSLAVAKKLGFDEKGILYMDKYQEEKTTSIGH